ncbi:MAG: hypothetical protein LIV24_07405 [Eubacterium sp.]|nr:hypothetical protein [Eubacterium sp.]
MNTHKISGMIAVGMSAALLLSGCSFSSGMNHLVGTITDTGKETVLSSSSEEETTVQAISFDTRVEAPVFNTDLAGSTDVAQNGTTTLKADASVSGGGTLSYQWYSNNVDSNGGGTKIEGATGAEYNPDTSSSGTTYYYVVAINTQNGKVNETTSSTHSVTVWGNMYWQRNADNGGFQYLNHDDGSYPSNTSMEIDGVTFTFNDSGFAVDPDTGAYVDVTQYGESAAESTSASSSANSGSDLVTSTSGN